MRHGSWILVGLALGCLMLGCNDKKAGANGPTSAGSNSPASATSKGAPGSTAKAPVSATPTSAMSAPGSKLAAAASTVAAVAKPNSNVPGDLPALTAALSAEHTVGFFAAERPQQLVVQIDKAIASTPAEVRAEMPAPLRDPVVRQQALGFDPTTAAGWLSAGLDPSGGAGLALDARIEIPLIVVKVADRTALMATLNRLGAQVSLGAEADGITPVTIAGATGLMGVRAGYTLLLPPDKGEPNRAIFAQILKSDAPLSQSSVLKRTFSDGVKTLWMSGWINGDAVAKFITRQHPPAADIAKFYAERFEAIGFAMGQTGGTMRVLAGAKGVTALRQLFVPAGVVPDFAKALTRDHIAMRIDINFTDFFDGVLALIPEQMAQPRSMVLMGKNAVPMAIGASFEQLGKALTGHIAVGMIPPTNQPPIPTIMLGVRDTKEADMLLKNMTGLLKTVHKAPITEGKVAGLDGYLLKDGGMEFAVVRADSIIYAGPVADIKQAMANSGALPGVISAQINAPMMFGFFVDFETILKTMRKTTPVKEFEAMASLAKSSWSSLLVEGFMSGRWTVDGRGLKLDGTSMMAFIGMGAAIAIPAFMKYIRRSKTIEASMNIRKLFDSSVSYYESEHATKDGTIQPKHFPASAPRTPATTACKDGESVKHVPTVDMWAHPTWQALNFAIDDEFYYQYEYVSDGKSFTARAIGDLDCDGVLSTFERIGSIDAEGTVTGGAGIFKKSPLE